MVLILGYYIYYFGSRTFTIEVNQFNLQQEVRLAAYFISREVRNAEELELVDALVPGDGCCYIFLEDGMLKYIDDSGVEIIKTEAVINELFPMFILKETENGKNLLEFTIQGRKETQIYEIKTEVLLNNISNKSETHNQVIRY